MEEIDFSIRFYEETLGWLKGKRIRLQPELSVSALSSAIRRRHISEEQEST